MLKTVVDISQVQINRLAPSHNFLPFECSDSDLRDFLLNDSKNYLSKLLAVTYIVEYNGLTIAFFSVSNDKISAEECKSNNRFKKYFKDRMPDGKQYKSYPAVKIGRFAVHEHFAGNGFGSQLLDYVKGWFISNNRTGCQYITVDAYKKSLKFYEKNNFMTRPKKSLQVNR